LVDLEERRRELDEIAKSALRGHELGDYGADHRERCCDFQRTENVWQRERQPNVKHLACASGAQGPRQLDHFFRSRQQARRGRHHNGKERNQKRDDDARQIGSAQRHHDDRRDGDDRHRVHDHNKRIERARERA